MSISCSGELKSGWCPESNDKPPTKKRKFAENSDNDLDDDLEENTAFQQLWKMAKALNKKRFNKMIDQMITDGEEKEQARDIAEGRIKPYEERTFFEKYEICLDDYLFPLQISALNKKIVSNVERLISKGLKQTPAIKRSLMKYRGLGNFRTNLIPKGQIQKRVMMRKMTMTQRMTIVIQKKKVNKQRCETRLILF